MRDTDSIGKIMDFFLLHLIFMFLCIYRVIRDIYKTIKCIFISTINDKNIFLFFLEKLTTKM